MGSISVVGQTFYHYHIVERIGAGGMGEVEPLGRRRSGPAKSRAQQGIGC